MNEKTVNLLMDQYPNLSAGEILMYIDPYVDISEIDQQTHQYLEMANESYNSPPPGASLGGLTVNNPSENTTSEQGWEIEAFGLEMNDRDDVYTVGLVVIIALLVYTAKVGIDHWFNKRLERYKKNLESEK